MSTQSIYLDSIERKNRKTNVSFKNLHHSMVHALCVTMQQYVTTDTLRYMVAISRPLMGIPEDKMQHMLSLQPVRGFVICRLQIKAGTSSKQVTTSNLKTCESLKLDLSPIKVTEMLMLEPEDEVQYLVYVDGNRNIRVFELHDSRLPSKEVILAIKKLPYKISNSHQALCIVKRKEERLVEIMCSTGEIPIRDVLLWNLQKGEEVNLICVSNADRSHRVPNDSPIVCAMAKTVDPAQKLEMLSYETVLSEDNNSIISSTIDHHIEILTKMKAELEELNNGSNKEQE